MKIRYLFIILSFLLLTTTLSAQTANLQQIFNLFLELIPEKVDSLQALNLFNQKELLNNNYTFDENKKLNDIIIELNSASQIKKYKKLLTDMLGDSPNYDENSKEWIKDGLNILITGSKKKAVIKISLAKFIDDNKFDLPKNVYILDYKNAPIYGNNLNQNIYLIGTKNDWSSPFWSNVWIYSDEGNGINEMIYMFQEPHNSAYQARLDFIYLLDNKTPQIIISSPTGGSGGIINLIVFSAVNAMPFVHFDSARTKDLDFTGELMDNYQAKICFNDSLIINLNLNKRKKMYNEYQIYEHDKLKEKIEVWGNAVVAYKKNPLNQKGLQTISFFQEVRGFANIDRIALINNEMALDNNNVWSLIHRDISLY